MVTQIYQSLIYFQPLFLFQLNSLIIHLEYLYENFVIGIQDPVLGYKIGLCIRFEFYFEFPLG